jgi:hypothetical protein
MEVRCVIVYNLDVVINLLVLVVNVRSGMISSALNALHLRSVLQGMMWRKESQ